MNITYSKKKPNKGIEVLFKKNLSKKEKKLLFNSNKNIFLFKKNKILVEIKDIKNANDWRLLGFKLSKYLENKVSKVYMEVPYESDEFIEGLYLGSYNFTYKTINKSNKLKEIILINKKNLNMKIKKSLTKIKSQFITRDLVNTSPNIATPNHIEKVVKKTFKNSDVKIKIYNENDLRKLSMNGHLAVSSGSKEKGRTIRLSYTPKKYKKHIILVGKGLTYDSGGLSIKPTSSMLDMQSDKAGAMSIIGIMNYIKSYGSKYKITAYLGIAENMISENSYRPGDILTLKNKKTVRILNTDAEGRLVLYDNICLAEEENPKYDELYTFATLTGSAVVQFGYEAAALVGFNDKLKNRLKKIANKEDEILLNAEFHKYMLDGVKDSIADLSNTGTKNMGCQKAGLFLTNALKEGNKKKYVHIDIAGPAYVDKDFGTNIKGGTGFIVRTFIRKLGK